jgi:hypothetical protein
MGFQSACRLGEKKSGCRALRMSSSIGRQGRKLVVSEPEKRLFFAKNGRFLAKKGQKWKGKCY